MDPSGSFCWDETDRRLYDFRAQPDLQMTGLTVNHPSSVIRIRQVEDHLLMVSGFENTVLPDPRRTDHSFLCMIYET
jgi:hypothetical protein